MWSTEYGKSWRQNNPEYNTIKRDLIKRKISNKKWAENNKDKIKVTQATWYSNNRDAKLEKNKDWDKNNPDKKRLHARKRRALKNNTISDNYLDIDILSKYGSDCYLCKNPIDLSTSRAIGSKGWEYSLHIEHVIPLSKGGNDTIENVRPSHALCNLRKGASL
jgi:5-methylcytosine-specific restriction endonuclease McrA